MTPFQIYQKTYKKQWYQAHKDEMKLRRAQSPYSEIQEERHKIYMKHWRQTHKSHSNAYARAYYRKNIDKMKAKAKAYHAKHRDKAKAYYQANKEKIKYNRCVNPKEIL